MSKYTQGDPRRYTFTASDQIGEHFSGLELLDPVRNKGGDEWVLISAHRTGGTGAYAAVLENAIPSLSSGTLYWEKVTDLSQSAKDKQTRIIPGCLYRFKSGTLATTVTGIECRISST